MGHSQTNWYLDIFPAKCSQDNNPTINLSKKVTNQCGECGETNSRTLSLKIEVPYSHQPGHLLAKVDETKLLASLKKMVAFLEGDE